MGKFSEEQLHRWSIAPSSTKNIYTHEQLRKAIIDNTTIQRKWGNDIEVYLQGSYANHTNINQDSDVDIVVELTRIFYRNLDSLPPFQKTIYESQNSTVSFSYSDFRADILNALIIYFGATAVSDGNKCIKIKGDTYRVNADILPCVNYRKFLSYYGNTIEKHVDGVKFITKAGDEVINFPKKHIENGEDKNSTFKTNNKYKDIVRIAKNAKKEMVARGIIHQDLAKSYFLECAIYNVSDSIFKENSSYSDILMKCIKDIYGKIKGYPSSLITVSEQHSLFGPNPWEWDVNNALSFYTAQYNFLFGNGS